MCVCLCVVRIRMRTDIFPWLSWHRKIQHLHSTNIRKYFYPTHIKSTYSHYIYQKDFFILHASHIYTTEPFPFPLCWLQPIFQRRKCEKKTWFEITIANAIEKCRKKKNNHDVDWLLQIGNGLGRIKPGCASTSNANKQKAKTKLKHMQILMQSLLDGAGSCCSKCWYYSYFFHCNLYGRQHSKAKNFDAWLRFDY